MSKNTAETKFTITSPAFENMGDIPLKYVYTDAGGENKSIPLSWSGVPENAKSLVLLVYDIHPVAHDWVHWLVTDIGTGITKIEDGASGTNKMPAGAKELKSSYGEKGYGGPCPPKGSGKHEYRVILYAVDVPGIAIREPINYAGIRKALEGNIIAQAEIKGYYER